MAQAIRHASAVKPITISNNTSISTDNIDRLQTFTPAISQPSDLLYEIGRRDKMATDKGTLETTVSIGQLEYGSLDTFLQFSGLSAEPSGGIELSDFDDARTDIMFPGKDEYAGTIEQTLWLEKLSLDGFTLEITADERLQRTFDLSGEFAKILRYGNKYLIFTTDDAPSGTSGNYVIDVSDPAPVLIPGQSYYILKIYRIRAGVATELDLTTDYTFNNGTNEITIIAASAQDHYRIWYSAASYGSAGDPTSLNDVDDYFLSAENVTITIDDGTHAAVELTKITGLNVNASLNRLDEPVIGTVEKAIKDIENYEVTCNLEGFVKDYPIEEALAGQAGQSYGFIDFSDLSEVIVTIKVYQEAAKSSFLIGYQMTGLELDNDTPGDFTANEFGSAPINLKTDNLLITSVIGNL